MNNTLTHHYKILHGPSGVYTYSPNGVDLDELIKSSLMRGWKMEDIKIEVIPR